VYVLLYDIGYKQTTCKQQSIWEQAGLASIPLS